MIPSLTLLPYPGNWYQPPIIHHSYPTFSIDSSLTKPPTGALQPHLPAAWHLGHLPVDAEHRGADEQNRRHDQGQVAAMHLGGEGSGTGAALGFKQVGSTMLVAD